MSKNPPKPNTSPEHVKETAEAFTCPHTEARERLETEAHRALEACRSAAKHQSVVPADYEKELASVLEHATATVRLEDLRTLLATPTQGDISSSRDHDPAIGSALEEVRQALERAAHIIADPSGYNTFECQFAVEKCRAALLCLPPRPFDPVRSPGHTDLLVPPEAIDTILSGAVTPAPDVWEEWRGALEFYANPEIYKPHPHGAAFDDRDLSYRAKAALSSAEQVAGKVPGMQNNTSDAPTQEGVGRLDAIMALLRMVEAAPGGVVSASDDPNSPVAPFCDDNAETDTFNLAIALGFLRHTLDGAENAYARVTNEGRRFLSLLPAPKPGEGGEPVAGRYVLREDEDGKLQIYSAEFNVRIATFARGVSAAERRAMFAAIEPQQPAPGAPEGWRKALEELRAALEKANSDGLITDTIWVGDAPLFDFIDLAPTSSSAKLGGEEEADEIEALDAYVKNLQAANRRLRAGLERIRDEPDTHDRLGYRWSDWAKGRARATLARAALTSSSAKPTEEDAEQIERRIEAGGVAGVCFYANYTPAKRLASLKHQARQKGQTAVVVHNPALLADDLETFDIPSAKPEKEGEYSAKPGGEEDGLLAAHKGVSEGKSLVIRQLEAQLEAHAQSNRRLREGLGAAARVFRDYQALHLIKDTAEGREKSARNREHAEMCEAALKDSALGEDGGASRRAACDTVNETSEDPRLIAANYTVTCSNGGREHHWRPPEGPWHDGYSSERAAARAALKHLQAARSALGDAQARTEDGHG